MTFMMVFIQLIITFIDKLAPSDISNIIMHMLDDKTRMLTPNSLMWRNSTFEGG